MQLSKRITGINAGGSDGWGVYSLAKKMEAQGHPVIHLTIGEHDIKTDPIILEAMYKAGLAGHTGYAFGMGTPGLRERIAKRVT